MQTETAHFIPDGATKLSIIETVSSEQGFIIHYVGYIWDSVSSIIRGVSSKRDYTGTCITCINTNHDKMRTLSSLYNHATVQPF